MMDPAKLGALLEHDCRVVVLQSVASTNDEAVRRAALDDAALDGVTPLVVVSAEQTAGRGRLGRTWASPPGGVYLSVLLEQDCDRVPEDSLASLSPLVALSLRHALKRFARDEPHIKWPNDVVTAQGKLAGVLVEVKRGNRTPSAESQLIVGIGVNVNRPRAGAFAGAAYLNDGARRELSREAIAAAIIDSLLERQGQWRAQGCSFAPFVAEYREHLVHQGVRVCVRDAMGTEVASGIVKGVDGRGRLLLEGARGVTAVAAGEVTLRDA